MVASITQLENKYDYLLKKFREYSEISDQEELKQFLSAILELMLQEGNIHSSKTHCKETIRFKMRMRRKDYQQQKLHFLNYLKY